MRSLKISMLKVSVMVLVLAGVKISHAQISRPSASPRAQLDQKVGLGNIKVDYGRPGVKGRKIFGSLEAFGKVWRTGANASTKVSFSSDVLFGGEPVSKGSYALYTIPQKKYWIIILSKNTGLWGAGGYKEEEDFLRVKVKVKKLKDIVETLVIGFENFHINGADLFIAWERTKLVIPIHSDSAAQVLAEIDAKVRNPKVKPSAQSYFDAGMYFYEKEIDLEKAEEWIDAAAKLRPSAFWYTYYQAELAQKLNKNK